MLGIATAVVLSVLTLEVGSCAVYRLLEGEPLPRAALRAKLFSGLRSETFPPAPDSDPFVVHPFLGYVHNRNAIWPRINEHGFFGKGPVLERSTGELLVAITGGSVAFDLCRDRRHFLIDRLSSDRRAEGRRIQLVCLSLYGYRQPQQLQTLTYFLSLGAQFDVVVNLDGFNELALPYAENAPAGVYPFFPRIWPQAIRDSLGLSGLRSLAAVEVLRDRRRALRRIFRRFPLRESAFILVLSDRLDRRLEREQQRLESLAAQRLSSDAPTFTSNGPPTTGPQDPALFEHLVAVWRDASRVMSALGPPNGFHYLHFLQPNPHVPGSKPLSDDERARMPSGKEYAYRRAILAGHPLARAAGVQLAEEGVAFTDLTQLFENTAETVYRDACCHLNELGSDLLSRAIAEEIFRALVAGPPSALQPPPR